MSATEDLRWLLKQEEPEARRIAVQQLTRIGGEDVSSLFIQALGDSDWRVRKEAAGLAPSFADRKGFVDAIIESLKESENIGLRNSAVEALIGIGGPVLQAILGAMPALDGDGRKLAVEVLSGIADPAAVEAIVEALSDPDLNVRLTAVDALRNASEAGAAARETAIVALTSLVDQPDPLIKLAAFGALSHLNAELPWSIFEALVDDPILGRYVIAAAAHSHDERAVAALAGAIGVGKDPLFHEALIAISDRIVALSDDIEYRRCAREKLQAFRGARAHVLPLLRDDVDPPLRGAALIVLALIGDASDIPLLVEALSDEDLATRAEHALRLYSSSEVHAALALSKIPPDQGG